jgi:tRNA (adenine37-N6)-methyltransferase
MLVVDATTLRSCLVNPVGFVRTASRYKFDAPSQPDASSKETNCIELLPGMQFEMAIEDLEGFDRIWLISWFHQNQHWRPRVMPPRGPAKRRGVFSTRSPHRPNPIGLTSVELLRIEGLNLIVGPLDLIDGTPILDIKPYLRTVDSHPESSLGWIESIEAEEREAPSYSVIVSKKAELELNWLKVNWGIDFTERAFRILSRDPRPHRTRRILQIEPNLYRIACGAWRLYYRIDGSQIIVEEVAKGYSDESLLTPQQDKKIIDREAQIAFADWKLVLSPLPAK